MRRRIKIGRLFLFLALGVATTFALAWAMTTVDVQQGANASDEAFVGHEHWTVTRYDRAGAVQVHSTRRVGLDWSPQQAAGPPDTPTAGDQVTAWASAGSESQPEWLILDYAKPVIPREVHVYENCSPGALTRVTVFTADGQELDAWSGTDPTPISAPMGTSKIPIRLNVSTSRVKIYLASDKVPGWNEVDAVALIDSSGQTQWARKVEASSTYASRSSGASIGNPAVLVPPWADLSEPGPAMRAGDSNYEQRIVDARGWPMLALYSQRDVTLTNTQPAPGGSGRALSGRALTGSGLVISKQSGVLTAVSAVSTPSAGGPVPIPLRPIWTGFAINSAIYTLLWWGAFLALTLPRRFFREVSRFRQGCCIQCGYDLGYDFVNGCPECGWRRDPTTAHTRRDLIASLDAHSDRH